MKDPYQQSDYVWHVGAKGDNHLKVSFLQNENNNDFNINFLDFDVQYEGEEMNFVLPIDQAKMLVNRLQEFLAIHEINNIATAVAQMEDI